MTENLLFEKIDGVAVITLNRPAELNAMDLNIRKDLRDIFEEINFDKEIGAIVLQGAGRAFCAGGDIKTMGGYSAGSGRIRLKNMHYLVRAVCLSDKPVIAALHGSVAGAGLSIALACDARIAAEGTKFIASFLNIGLVPDSGSFYFLPRLVGMAKAKEIVYRAKPLLVEEALSAGLINKIEPADSFREAAFQLAAEIAQKPRTALAITKSIMNRSFEMDLDQALDFEAMAQDICFLTQDHSEGVNAFLEKRKARFNK